MARFNAKLLPQREEQRIIREANLAIQKLDSMIDSKFIAGDKMSIADIHIIFCFVIT